MKKIFLSAVALLAALLIAVPLLLPFASAATSENNSEIPVYAMTSKWSDLDAAIDSGIYSGLTDKMDCKAGTGNWTKYYSFSVKEESKVYLRFHRGTPKTSNADILFEVFSDPAYANAVGVVKLNAAAEASKALFKTLSKGEYYVKATSIPQNEQDAVAYEFGIQIGAMSDKISFIKTEITKTDTYTDLKIITNEDKTGLWVRKEQNIWMPWSDVNKINTSIVRIPSNFGYYEIRIQDKYGNYYDTRVGVTSAGYLDPVLYADTEIPVYQMTDKWSDLDRAVDYAGLSDSVAGIPAYDGSEFFGTVQKRYAFTLTEDALVYIKIHKSAPKKNPWANYCGFWVSDGSGLMNEEYCDNWEDTTAAANMTYFKAFPAGTHYIEAYFATDYTDTELAYDLDFQIGALPISTEFMRVTTSGTEAYADLKIETNEDCASVWVRKGEYVQSNTNPWSDAYKINGRTYRVSNDFGVYTVSMQDKYGNFYHKYVNLVPLTQKDDAEASSFAPSDFTSSEDATSTPNSSTSVSSENTVTSAETVSSTVSSGQKGEDILSPVPILPTVSSASSTNKVYISPSTQKSTKTVADRKPKPTYIKTLVRQKKALTVKWKKSSNASGYKIRYSTNKQFKKNVKVKTVKKGKTVSIKLKSLKPKKRYYIQVRAYRKIGGKVYYSTWSKSKTVKTR